MVKLEKKNGSLEMISGYNPVHWDESTVSGSDKQRSAYLGTVAW